ncbi:DNA-binding protein [candidate division WWE3 bacterium]|jgi:excisionase family DNA binding protein|uniref:DNA-binding protein n=1 Tax=candidate division WWE3 bacterium TaxID=2053526 RepID=A0A3A4ZN73_UNCKA|nr:MAG: DNA-binding protein [candidate division WWE3 bacterium]
MIQLEEKLYTSTEVAEILGVSLRSVYRYLEENKLQAEVKTATGRHRFSKQNILDFLYPNGIDKPAVTLEEKKETLGQTKVTLDENIVEKDTNVEETNQDENVLETPEEEPIDWLAKFREAAKKFREESDEQPAAEAAVEPVTQPDEPKVVEVIEQEFVQETVTQFSEPVKPKEAVSNKYYYRSGLGGLKDIAQNIDKNSRTSFLDYAFTLNAGLSLFKPIKPFSMLHVYVRPNDLSFFEKTLALTPSEESNAQLCLLVSDDNAIYSGREELHGLFVVSKERLSHDIKTIGDGALSSEAQSVLG